MLEPRIKAMKTLIIDIDSVLLQQNLEGEKENNRNTYAISIARSKFNQETIKAIEAYRKAGWFIYGMTNQSGFFQERQNTKILLGKIKSMTFFQGILVIANEHWLDLLLSQKPAKDHLYYEHGWQTYKPFEIAKYISASSVERIKNQFKESPSKLMMRTLLAFKAFLAEKASLEYEYKFRLVSNRHEFYQLALAQDLSFCWGNYFTSLTGESVFSLLPSIKSDRDASTFCQSPR